MERWILILCHERPGLANLQREWQKEGISVRMASEAGEAAGELSGDTDYLLAIIFSEGKEYLSPLKIMRWLTKAPILVVDRHYDSTEKTAAVRAGRMSTSGGRTATWRKPLPAALP